MAQNIGSNGLAEVNLTIPQGTSLAFTVEHRDSDGELIDHSTSTAKMAFQAKDGTHTYLSEYATGTEAGVEVSIPASVTADFPLGKQKWDLIAEMASGDKVRLAYGSVSVIDTYALDGEDDE